ncbi:MAG TPA: hypothetical protein VG758_08310 [Hyphomicrobiaceae bacterium]|jgi:hypothetical protein|nr:hypothetical protein [Hyphomicrobiaceae bacterium]
MRSVVFTASLATAILSGSSGAFAQRDTIETYRSDLPYYEEYVEPAPGVYRYRNDFPAVVPVRPANCGEFRYWNGERCVDARIFPPDLR